MIILVCYFVCCLKYIRTNILKNLWNKSSNSKSFINNRKRKVRNLCSRRQQNGKHNIVFYRKISPANTYSSIVISSHLFLLKLLKNITSLQMLYHICCYCCCFYEWLKFLLTILHTFTTFEQIKMKIK